MKQIKLNFKTLKLNYKPKFEFFQFYFHIDFALSGKKIVTIKSHYIFQSDADVEP